MFAELQTAGRGRRGREWLAPFGSGLTFSIGWTFAEMPADLSALGLAMGVCVVRALRELGATDVQLKWPNDIVHRHPKLGGLLLQMRSEAGGPAYVVAGLGLNCMPESARAAIRSPARHAGHGSRHGVWRNATVPARHGSARRRSHARRDSPNFRARALRSFARDWADFDSLRDAPVTVLRHDGQLEGIARGADAEGALRVEVPGGVIERVHAGDVSLRRSLQAKATRRMILLVDVGNTRVKWATLAGGRQSPQQAAAYAQWSAADWHRELFGGPGIEHVVATTVAGSDSRVMLEAAARQAGARTWSSWRRPPPWRACAMPIPSRACSASIAGWR